MIFAQGSAFTVNDIRVEGLQRISPSTVFAALPIAVGDPLTQQDVAASVRSLFKTGNFDDVKIGVDGGVLVIVVAERPSINEINIEGNKAIETDPLLEGLKDAGLSEGKVFKRSTLEGMRVELERQYVSQGRYNAEIDTDIESESRNRVNVNINIDEGNVAKIKSINFIGNSVFDDDKLSSLIESRSTGRLSWLNGNDKYSKEKLSGDFDTIRSYYLDRGYVSFDFDSTQVSVTPDRKSVYISVVLNEGLKYEVGDVELSGDLVVSEDQLTPFLLVKNGQTFSQQIITSTEKLLTQRLGNDGYNFARVKGITEVDDENQKVGVKFFIDPGKRTYVRRINFNGNARTSDEVLRREMRQMEASPASSAKIEQSKVRLQRLGYFKGVEVDIQPVPASDDLIDVNYSVEEQSSGSIGASVGFSQDSGLILGANLEENNFLGTGKRVGIGISQSDFRTSYSFSYVNPYFTEDGVSRGFSVFFRSTDLEEINVASYTADSYGGAVSFGYPIKETERLNFSLGYSHTDIQAGIAAVKEIISSPRQLDGVDFFVERPIDDNGTPGDTSDDIVGLLSDPMPIDALDPGAFSGAENQPPGFLNVNGDEFDAFTLTAGWNQSTLNRGLLATRGASQRLSLELAIPGSDLQYFKLRYNAEKFFPISNAFTLRLRTELAYGDGYGGSDELPFFEHFFGGGFGSVRGYRSNTLGPRSTPADVFDRVSQTINGSFETAYVVDAINGVQQPINSNVLDDDRDPFGGNILVVGNAELLFPLPFIEDQRSIRSAFFVDAGNVFDSSCGATQINCHNINLRELRYSVGVGLTWITGFGPLTFSFAKALDPNETDRREFFQFSLGRSF